MEHMLNCHGEWNAVYAALGLLANLPLLGFWLRSRLASHSHDHGGE